MKMILKIENILIIYIYGGFFADNCLSDSDTKQKFAVVASGPIINGYLNFESSAECPCEKCDSNHPGSCLCEDDKIGHLCQINIERVQENNGSFTVKPLEIKRVRFTSNELFNRITSTSDNPGRDATVWISSKCHLSLGEYRTNGKTTSESESKSKISISATKDVCIAIFNNNDREATYNLEVFHENPPKKKKCGSSKKCNDDDDIARTSSIVLGDFEIQNVYIGATSIFNFDLGYNLMKKARKTIGHVVPPPNFLHSAIWIGPSNSNDETLGAIYVYGKYYAEENDNTYLSKDGARSYIMSLKEFKEHFDAFNIRKVSPGKRISHLEFMKNIKASGKWEAGEYNWPINNCQHFTASCLKILKAFRDIPNEFDWADIPPTILNELLNNENNK